MTKRTIRKSFLLLCLEIFFSHLLFAQTNMQQIYEQVKTPYKYGLVITPQNSTQMVDCPSIFRHKKFGQSALNFQK